MSSVPDLYSWMRDHSRLRISDLSTEGFTVASVDAPNARIVRFELDDEVLSRTEPILEAQCRDTLLPSEEPPSEPAWTMLVRYLATTIRTMPAQVTRLALTPEGSLRLSA
jgi:hypothetical protein